MEHNTILVIGNTISKSARLLANAAKKKGYVVDFLSSAKIRFENGEFVFPDGVLSRDFYEYDCYFFRGISRKPEKQEVYHSLARKLDSLGKRVVEQLLVEGALPEDSVVPESKHGLYKVPTTYTVQNTDIDTLDVQYPIVAKKFGLSMGKGVKKVHSKEELESFVGQESQFLLQEYFDFEFDTRVLVVGGVVVGGLDRYRPEGETFLTTRYGGKRERAHLTPLQKEAALEAVRLKKLAIAGVDLFMYDNKVYVIEVNESPQFNIFSTYTKISAADYILDHLARV